MMDTNTPEPNALKDALARKLQHHDWSYQYSDDHGAWSRGNRSWNEIVSLCQQLGAEEARKVWDANIPEEYKEMFQFPL